MPPEGRWRIWLLCTGRRWGKNWTESNWLHSMAALYPKHVLFVAGRTMGDIAKTSINLPKSGILATQDPDNPVIFKRHLSQLQWANGCRADLLSSEEPDSARGPEYAGGLADELATWKRVADFKGNTLWANILFATAGKLPGGAMPQIVVGTTPRPTKLIADLIAEGESDAPRVALTGGTIYDNAENLGAGYIEDIEHEFKDTYLFDQEALGKLLTAIEGAILTQEQLNNDRIEMEDLPPLKSIAIGCDPAGKKRKTSDRTGIEAVGLDFDDHLYALENRSLRGTPLEWGTALVDCWEYWEPRCEGSCVIVAEDNYGGQMVKSNIEGIKTEGDSRPRVIEKTAVVNKSKRASSILRRHEQRRAHIVGKQPRLESQLCGFKRDVTWEGEGSPDDADAYVWGALEVTGGNQSTFAQWAQVNA